MTSKKASYSSKVLVGLPKYPLTVPYGASILDQESLQSDLEYIIFFGAETVYIRGGKKQIVIINNELVLDLTNNL